MPARMMIEASPLVPPSPESGSVAAVRWSIWARRLLLLVVAAFVGATLWRLGRGFRSSQIELHWPLILLVTSCLAITNLMQAMAWVRLLNRMTHRWLPIPPILSGFMAGQLARYVPTGKVALLVVRTAAIGHLGLSARLVASSIGIEVLSWLTMGVLIGTATMFVADSHLAGLGPLLSTFSLPLASATVIAIVVLVSVDRRRFPNWALRQIRAEGDGPILSLPVLGWQAGSWLGPVLQGLLLPLAVGANFAEAWPNVGMFLLAPIAGFLAVVAPGGLGVREAVLCYALAPQLGASRALAVALLARATFVVSEILSYTIARWLSRAKSN
jgi:glycosyltransferase 2 family protein